MILHTDIGKLDGREAPILVKTGSKVVAPTHVLMKIALGKIGKNQRTNILCDCIHSDICKLDERDEPILKRYKDKNHTLNFRSLAS